MEENKKISQSEAKIHQEGHKIPLKSIEGWIIFVTGIHPEAQEDDIYDLFSEYGKVKNLHLNLDRRTGSNKGYALIEYEDLACAQSAISQQNQKLHLGKILKVDFAFKNPN